MKTLKCGIIGCGRIGCGFDDKNHEAILTHAGSYFKNPRTNLVALCDIDKKKLKKYGKKYDVSNLYTDSSEFFKKENLDCVSICTLANNHLNLVKEASKHHIQVIFLEKPISYDLKTARQIINICKQKKIVLIVDHKRRFDPFYHSLSEFFKQNF